MESSVGNSSKEVAEGAETIAMIGAEVSSKRKDIEAPAPGVLFIVIFQIFIHHSPPWRRDGGFHAFL